MCDGIAEQQNESGGHNSSTPAELLEHVSGGFSTSVHAHEVYIKLVNGGLTA